MTWVRLDDSMMDHPKLLEAGPVSTLIHLWAMCYSARFLTDGFVPRNVIRSTPWVSSRGGLSAAVKRLVVSGLWTEEEGGYRIHDYLEYNPDAASVKAKREAGRERANRWRHGVTNSVSNAVSNAAPSPYRSKDLDSHGVTPSVHKCPRCGVDKRTAQALADHLELIHA